MSIYKEEKFSQNLHKFPIAHLCMLVIYVKCNLRIMCFLYMKKIYVYTLTILEFKKMKLDENSFFDLFLYILSPFCQSVIYKNLDLLIHLLPNKARINRLQLEFNCLILCDTTYLCIMYIRVRPDLFFAGYPAGLSGMPCQILPDIRLFLAR